MSETADPHLLAAVAPCRGRVPSLDGLRAVSIVIVLMHHFISPLPGMPSTPGFLGVDIFFAISGFLIARLLLVELLETGRLSLGEFYLRRAFRLMPALLAFIAGVTAFEICIGRLDLRPTACALFYVTNYCVTGAPALYSGPGDYLKATWSLAVEEHFYLVFPLLLVVCFRRNMRLLYAAVGAMCIAAFGFRLLYALLGAPEMFLVWRTETALDMIMGGCALSIMSAHPAGRVFLSRLAQSDLLVTTTVVYIFSLAGWSMNLYGIALSQTALALWLPVLIANLLLNPSLAGIRALLNRPLMIWLGKISYSLYLWHGLVAFVGQYFDLIDTLPGAIGAVALSLALAQASWRWIEQPVLRRRSVWLARLGMGVQTHAPAE